MKENEENQHFLNEPKDENGQNFDINSPQFESFIQRKKTQRKALSFELAGLFFPEITFLRDSEGNLRDYEGNPFGSYTLTSWGKKYHGAFIVINEDEIRLN